MIIAFKDEWHPVFFNDPVMHLVYNMCYPQHKQRFDPQMAYPYFFRLYLLQLHRYLPNSSKDYLGFKGHIPLRGGIFEILTKGGTPNLWASLFLKSFKIFSKLLSATPPDALAALTNGIQSFLIVYYDPSSFHK